MAVRQDPLFVESNGGQATITRERFSTDVSPTRGLLDREGLLQLLDRAATRRVTVISAPPGSGKTSLLRAWADRSATVRHVAFVSVDRDQEHALWFWCAVLDAIRGPARSLDSEPLAGPDRHRRRRPAVGPNPR